MQTKLSRLLEQNLDALNALFEADSRVLGVWLFGSQADGTATEQSDIDLAVLFASELSLDEQLRFQVQVCEILRTDDIDILDLNRANLRLRFRSIAGRLLYERDFVRVADFIEETIIAYRDFEPRAQSMLRDYFATL